MRNSKQINSNKLAETLREKITTQDTRGIHSCFKEAQGRTTPSSNTKSRKGPSGYHQVNYFGNSIWAS